MGVPTSFEGPTEGLPAGCKQSRGFRKEKGLETAEPEEGAAVPRGEMGWPGSGGGLGMDSGRFGWRIRLTQGFKDVRIEGKGVKANFRVSGQGT